MWLLWALDFRGQEIIFHWPLSETTFNCLQFFFFFIRELVNQDSTGWMHITACFVKLYGFVIVVVLFCPFVDILSKYIRLKWLNRQITELIRIKLPPAWPFKEQAAFLKIIMFSTDLGDRYNAFFSQVVEGYLKM